MDGMQAMFPVYLPKRGGDQSEEDYNTMITQNENNMNQNFSILFAQIQALTDENEKLRAYISAREGK